MNGSWATTIATPTDGVSQSATEQRFGAVYPADARESGGAQNDTAIAILEATWVASQGQVFAEDDIGVGAITTQSISYLDNSPRALEGIYALAARGHAEALSAFLILGPGSSDYPERALQLLYIHGANGNTLALSTLAEWSATGFGFATNDLVSSIAFDYLAWLTTQWGSDDFRPTGQRNWTATDCLTGVAAGRAFAMAKPWAVKHATRNPALACTTPEP